MKGFFAFLVVFAFITGARADMYPDASNAKLPDARTNMAIAPHVATNAALLAASTVNYPTGVWRDTFGTSPPNNAPPVWYLPSNSLCSLAAGAGDNGAQVKSSDGKCWIAQFSAAGVDVGEWGAIGDGTTNDTVAFQSALDGSAGHYILLGVGRSYYIGSVTIKDKTTLKGTFGNIGAPNYHNVFYDFSTTPSIRLVEPGGTITTGNSSTIDGVLIYRAGMTFPAANSSAFAGTAITVAGDSFTMRNSLVMGFNLAISSGAGANGYDKGLIEDCSFDNQSNISINFSADTWKIHAIHAWPWATYTPTASDAALVRTGTNFQESNSNDAAIITDYLAFGYATSFSFVANQGAICTNCDADGRNTQVGSIGFSITGANGQATLVNPSIYGRATGIYVNHTGGIAAHVNIMGGTLASAPTTGINVDTGSAGYLLIRNFDMGAVQTAMEVNSASEVISMASSHIGTAVNAVPIHVPGATSKIFLGPDNVFGDPVTDAGRSIMTANATAPVVASGTSVSLPPVGNVFTVSGTATFQFVNGEWAGRVVTLVFQGAATVQNTTGGGFGTIQLNGSTNYVGSAGSTLTLASNGGNGWFEIGRMKP